MSLKDLQVISFGARWPNTRCKLFQLCTPLCFLLIIIGVGVHQATLQLHQPTDKILRLFFHIFDFLGGVRQRGEGLFNVNVHRSV